jgi:penicillin-binding protein A
MSHQLRRLAFAFAAAFFLIAASAGYWGYAQQTSLLARADNPRRLLLEHRFPRGTIFDRDGRVLAESVGPPGDLTRHYPYPDLAPVLGYVSPFFGTAGIEAAADGTLHGDAGRSAFDLNWFTLLGAPPSGRAVRLSIDLALQTATDEALGNRVGAVVLLDATTGEILALASHPTYDPNTLDTQWESLVNDPQAPLLNRATLGLYQPGGALHPIVLAAALRSGLVQLNETFPSATAEVSLGNLTLNCLTPPSAGAPTLAQAFQEGCPRPFATLGEQLGVRALDQLFADFRLLEAPAIGIPTAAANYALQPSETALAAIGQSQLTITPLHLALITAALARQGEMPVSQLLLATEDPQGDWLAAPPVSHSIAAIAPEIADQVKALMPAGYRAVALTNLSGQKVAWYSGFAPFINSRYTVAVLLENGDVNAAAQIGQALLATALKP